MSGYPAMNPLDHQNIPVGTLHEQDSDREVKVYRDWNTLLLGGWRIPLSQVPALRAILDDAEPGMAAAQAEMAKEAEEGSRA